MEKELIALGLCNSIGSLFQTFQFHAPCLEALFRRELEEDTGVYWLAKV